MQHNSIGLKKFVVAGLFYLMPFFLFAQKDFDIKDVSGFQASCDHWMDIIRTGYACYGYWPQRIISVEYPTWLQKITQ